MTRCCALALCLGTWGLATPARAAPDLVVVEVSEADAPAANRLAELVGKPVQRLRDTTARNPEHASALLGVTGARNVVVLDTEARRVSVLRAGDAAVLSRNVEPEPDAREGYVVAFVAYELLRLSADLEPEQAAPRIDKPRRVGIAARLGGELQGWSTPFSTSLRPAVGAGVSAAIGAGSRLALLALVEASAFGRAEAAIASGRLELARSDAGLRLQLSYALAPRLALGAFLRPRLSFLDATYTGAGGASVHALRPGIGVGGELECLLEPWLALYLGPALDVALRRSEYRVQGVARARDPASAFVLAVGLAFHERFP